MIKTGDHARTLDADEELASLQPDIDPKLARRRIRRRLGNLGLTGALVGVGIAVFSGSGQRERTTVVTPGQTVYGIAEKTLKNRGDKTPGVAEINAEVQKIDDANPEVIGTGGTAGAGVTLKIP